MAQAIKVAVVQHCAGTDVEQNLIWIKGGIPEKMKAGLKKYNPKLRKHTLHKIKRK